MADNIFDVGYYGLHIATIETYDKKRDKPKQFNLSNFIVDMSFTESINSSVIAGKLLIADTYGLLDRLPLRGEEVLRLEYSDFFSNKIKQVFFVHKIDNVGPMPQGSGVGFILHFCSPGLLISSVNQIKKSYTGTMGEIANTIHNQYFGNNDTFPSTIEIEDTIVGTQTVIIPAMSPLEALHFIKRRCYSVDNKSSNFYFFEVKGNKYRIITHEQLIKNRKEEVYTYHPNVQMDINSKSESMYNINKITFPKRFSTLDEINSGGMLSDTIEIDILNKQYLHNIYNHNDNFDDYTHTDKTAKKPHTNLFIEDFMQEENAVKGYLIFKDFERSNQNYKEIIGPRMSNNYYINNITCEIDIYGRNDLEIGDVLTLDIPKFENIQGDRTLNDSLSGDWVIHTINHNFSNKEYKAQLLLFKDAYKGDQQ